MQHIHWIPEGFERIATNMASDPQQPLRPWQRKLHEVIFEADTFVGKLFDVALLFAILISVVAVMLESVSSIRAHYGTLLSTVEWVLTALFTIEYVLRLACVRYPSRYALSFFGIVDFLAIAPTYASLLFSGSQSLIVIRVLRLLRVFRIFKLPRYLGEAQALLKALYATQARIAVFLLFVLVVVLIMGSAMYLVEGRESGFTSIPKSVYWATVTMIFTEDNVSKADSLVDPSGRSY